LPFWGCLEIEKKATHTVSLWGCYAIIE